MPTTSEHSKTLPVEQKEQVMSNRASARSERESVTVEVKMAEGDRGVFGFLATPLNAEQLLMLILAEREKIRMNLRGEIPREIIGMEREIVELGMYTLSIRYDSGTEETKVWILPEADSSFDPEAATRNIVQGEPANTVENEEEGFVWDPFDDFDPFDEDEEDDLMDDFD